MKKLAFQFSKCFYLLANCLVVPSLNVMTTNDLVFIPFLLLCRDIHK